ncbi:MAG: hypothetical protein ABJA82_08010 [Myxococcales bacterium]
MTAISRRQFDSTLANHAIDVRDPALDEAVAGSGLDLAKLDRLDGTADGRISGHQALEQLYAEVDALDKKTAGLASRKERAISNAVKGAAIAPIPISAEQGKAAATAARQLLAENARDSLGRSRWSHDGSSACANPALSSPTYAPRQSFKCNVFAGEALYRAGLPFPLNAQNHYVVARLLPEQSTFFQKLPSIEQAREGDLLSIYRGRAAGHVEVITAVLRNSKGKITGLRSIGAHEDGVHEGTRTAASFLAKAQRVHGALVTPDEILRILRPLAPPVAPQGPSFQFGVPLKG